MCGIVGYVGERQARSILVDGLRRLEYRGYDSAGLVVHHDGKLRLSRAVGRVSELDIQTPSDFVGRLGIAHTRWATHGGVTKANAHPHLDATNRIALVHNGIIENMRPLKERLIERGVEFRSETDSEVLVQLISRLYFGQSPSLTDGGLPELDPVAAIRSALKLVRGTWGIAVIFADHPGKIIAARNGSPLVIGLGEGETFLASDSHAIVRHTRRVVYMEDREISLITADGVETTRLDGAPSSPHVLTLEEQWSDGERGDYPHFMLKEIHEQTEAMDRCLKGRINMEEGSAKLGGFEMEPRELIEISRVVLLGCGTAYHASLVGAAAIEGLARIPATAEIASEFRHKNPVIDPNALYLAVSQSGETADTLGAVKEVQVKGGRALGVINVVGSTIARACGRGVYIHSGPEMAVASTKAFTNMVAALYLFTLQLARTRTLSPHEGRAFGELLMRVPGQIGDWLAADHPEIDEVVRWVTEAKMVLFLGRGPSAAAAAEGALKLMEVAYVPCIAYPSGEMKHGPIALLEKGSPVVVIAPDDDLKDKTLSNLQECRARGARVFLIHSEGDPIAAEGDISIAVPRSLQWFSPLLSVLPLQLLAYKTGLALERDIDRPRNLAKSVTVE